MTRYLVPLGVFLLLAAFLAVGLKLDPREVPSPFIGKPAPALDLPTLNGAERITGESLRGRVWVLNVWASWCVACRAEHELLNAFAAQSPITLVGLNYKDATADARQWLANLGNPYTVVAVDANGDTGIEWGVYGVPETFVMDKQGIVRYKHIGPVDQGAMDNTIVPLIRQLENEA